MHVGGPARPNSYTLPMNRVPDGWYVVCSLSSECSQPFEKV